jgi:hypothetical protein
MFILSQKYYFTSPEFNAGDVISNVLFLNRRNNFIFIDREE